MSRRLYGIRALVGMKDRGLTLSLLIISPVLMAGMLFSVLQVEAQQEAGKLRPLVEAVAPARIAAKVSGVISQEAGRLQAESLVERLQGVCLRTIAEARNSADPAEQALLDTHLTRTTTPRALQEALLATPSRPISPPTGKVVGAVETDKGTIRYIAMVPKNYSPQRAWPLHISLHGGGGSPRRSCIANWQGAPERQGVILLCPTVPKGGWWLPGGEDRLKQALDHLKTQYRVDLDRVSIGGASSGGAGVWHQATRYPWVWRAAIPRCAALPLDHGTLKNLAQVPTYLMHGSRDGTILVHNSRLGHEMLQGFGYASRYHEDPKVGHNFMHDHNDALLDWLADLERGELWGNFTYRTSPHGLAPSRVHWLRPDWGDSYQPGHVIEGSVTRRFENGRWLIEAHIESTAKLRGFGVLLSSGGIQEGAVARVVYKGELVHSGVLAPDVGVLLDSWADYRDPALLTPFGVEVTLGNQDETRPPVGALGPVE